MGELHFEKLHDLPLLLDIYGNLLTKKQQQALRLSFEEDCSLSEIADLHGSSRQAAFNLIERGEAQLREYEAALGLLAKEQQRQQTLEQLSHLLHSIPMDAEERIKTEELLCRL